MTELLDFLEVRIETLYKKRLNDRVLEDEFDVENPTDSLDPKDTTFYTKCFLPEAVYQTYMEIHRNYEDIWDDVFSLGSGSKTRDLIPETNAVCFKCGSAYFKTLKGVDALEIKNINYQVLKAQQHNFFLRTSIAKFLQRKPSDCNSDLGSDRSAVKQGGASEVDIKSSDNSFVCDIDTEVVDRSALIKVGSDCEGELVPYNPFSESCELDSKDKHSNDEKDVLMDFNPFSSDDSSDEGTNHCELCKKSFSLSAYLDYHNKVFHKNLVKSIRPRFVSDGEDLMISFTAVSGRPEHHEINTKSVKVSVTMDKKLRKSRRNLKFK